MSLAHLRPRTAGEILDGAFVLYRRHFVRFSLLVLLYFVPMVLLVWTVMAFDPESSVIGGLAAMLLVAWALAGTPFTWAALTRLASQVVHGDAPSFRDAFASGCDAALPLLGTGIMINLASYAIMMGVLLVLVLVQLALAPVFGEGADPVFALVAVAVTLGVTLVFCAALFAVVPAVVIEQAGPVSALLRSWRLAGGGWGRVVGVSLVSGGIVLLPLFGMVAAYGGLGSLASVPAEPPGLVNFGAWLATMLIGPFYVLSSVLLYYDQRLRAEGFDLELAAARLPVTA
jgi:hypothetical protein